MEGGSFLPPVSNPQHGEEGLMTKPRESNRKIPVSDGNLKKAAQRLLNQDLVSTEVQFVKNQLGTSATQGNIDQAVVAVRELPWASIVLPD